MKISALLLAAFACFTFSAHVHAQEQDYNDGLKQELSQDVEKMYPKRPKADAQAAAAPKIEVQTVKAAQVQPAPAQAQIPVVVQAAPAPVVVQTAPAAQPAPQPAPQLQPVYILQQPQAAPPAQTEPVTTVEDTPVKEPKIESLRKQREEVERQTEDKFLQKLEDDRLEAEKERAERVEAFPMEAPSPSPTPAPQAAAPVAQQAVMTPVQTPATPVVAEPVTPAVTSVDAVSTTKVEGTSESDENQASKLTIGALGGIGSYPTVANISGTYAAGVALGVIMPSHLGLEADALFSSYQIQNTTPCTWCGPGQSLVETLNQMNFTGGLDYYVLSGRVTPVVGILAGYTRRNYSNLITYGASSGGTTSSGAFDGGLKAGVDVNATDKLTVSLDFLYMMNISYTTDNPLTYFGPVYGSPIEGLNYYIASLGLKLSL